MVIKSEGRWITLKYGEGCECHDDGRSITMGHDDLKIATGRLLDGNGTVMGQ
jgi:hypothetical protein